MPIGSSTSLKLQYWTSVINILINMDTNENTAMVTLDLSAAFDTVNHKTFIKKFKKKFGIWEKP